MEKSHIVAEIQRTTAANAGVPLGWRRFEEETGIKYYDWFGRFGRGGVTRCEILASSRIE